MSSKRTFVITDVEKNEYRVIASDIGSAVTKLKTDHGIDENSIKNIDCNASIGTFSLS